MNTLLHPQVITASLAIDIKLNKKRKRNDIQFYNVMAKKVKVSKFPDDQSLPKSSTHGTTHRQTQPKGRAEEIPDDNSLLESSTHRQT
jgi:hypothetical protein